MGDSVDRDYAELRAKVAGLEGHVNTTQAKNETAIERLQASMAQFGKDAAERENRLVNRMTILFLGGLALAVAVLKLI